MAGRAENERIRILDDFVCEAIPGPGVPQADPTKLGEIEGTRVVEEIVFDAGADGKEAREAEQEVPAGPGKAVGFDDVASPIIAACRSCGRLDARHRLKCCDSPACEACIRKMFHPQREAGVTFRCSICGHTHSESASA